MDEPPSFTSAITRNLYQQQDSISQTIEPKDFEQDEYNPSISKIRSQPDHPFDEKTETVGRKLVQPTETYDHDDIQPFSIGSIVVRGDHDQNFSDQLTDNSEQSGPSIGCIVHDKDNSQTAGGDFMRYDAPPSRSNLAPQDPTHTGDQFSGGQNIPEGNYEEVSLTGRNFGRSYPKEEGQYSLRF